MLAYDRSGSGEPLILIHPLGGARLVWEPVTPMLAPARDVIAVDLPGFGESPPPEPHDEATPRALAQAVADTMDELGIERAHVAGNSLGGWVAFELERLGRALSVTGIGTAGLWSRPLGPRPGRTARDLVSPFRGVIGAALASGPLRTAVLTRVTVHPERVPRGAARRLIAGYLGAPGFDAANRAMRAGVLELPAGDVPVTLAWPEHDRLVGRPRRVPPGVRSVVMPGCGHLPMWDDPALVARVLLDGSADRAAAAR